MLHVVGVRHHSPACARVVRHVIERVRPRLVLVEGPADMNPRMGELALDHQLPIAVFTHVTEARSTRVSWTPFCDHSPEWVALRTARAVGAEALFIDLPGWHPAFAAGRDRYAEPPRRALALHRLLERAGIDDVDTLWDHLFEGETDLAALAARLEAFFAALRGDDPAEGDDAPREAFMIRAVAWALAACEAEGGDVLAVCGGFHAPVLAREGPRAPREHVFPAIADAEVGAARRGSFVVPHGFARLSSLAGHAPGMSTPAWDDALFRLGAEEALPAMLGAVIARLRDRKHPVSTASLVACLTAAQGLAHLRGRRAPLRVDLLDAIASTLVDEALDAPLPWAGGGSMADLTRAHPVLREALGALIGDRRGALAPGTPRPPLVRDVARALDRARIPPGGRLSLDLLTGPDRETSADLHRLQILGIPGVARAEARGAAPRQGLREEWAVTWNDGSDAAVLEAASFGATLEGAASARLEEEIAHHVADAAALATALVRAVWADLPGLAARVGDDVARVAGHEASLARAGAALAAVHDASTELAERASRVAGPAPLAVLLQIAMEVTFDRALWLLEGLVGPTRAAVAGELRAVNVMAVVAGRAAPPLRGAAERASAVARRRVVDADAPASIRGACLGLVWRLGGGPSAADGVRAVRASSQPRVLGDFLAGLFAVAREEVLACRELVATVDGIVAALSTDDFLIALPALRWAFAHFPPREREAIAEHVLALHGGAPGDARGLVRAPVDVDAVTRAHRLELEVDRILARHGLVSASTDPVSP